MADLPAALDHWHPVLLSRELGTRPKATRLLGVELALFRTAGGRVGALVDRCPHRRMRLSCGWVEGERLVCPYHGMSFAPDGEGASPSTPRMRLEAQALDAVERHGALWVRRRGAPTAFPEVERGGFRPIAPMRHEVGAPLELVVDNFCEVEHTPTTHALFGYTRASLGTLDVRVELADDTVRVVNRGPQKEIPRWAQWAFGVRPGDPFIDDWTVRFSPVHIVYHQWWEEPSTGRPRPDALHVAVFFVPRDAATTALVTFAATNRRPPPIPGAGPALRALMSRIVAREVELDVAMLERLADPDPDLHGMRLSRFDRPLREHRRRIEALYRTGAR